MTSDPAAGVLADLLLLASEAGAERLVETDRLLRDLAGPEAVDAAHEEWTARLSAGLEPDPHPATLEAPDAETFEMLSRLRATRPGGL